MSVSLGSSHSASSAYQKWPTWHSNSMPGSRLSQCSEGDGRSSVPAAVSAAEREATWAGSARTETDTADDPSTATFRARPSGCRRTDRGALPAESARVQNEIRRGVRPRVECVFEHLAGRAPGAGRTGRAEFRGPTLRAHPFASRRFHVLLNSLFKVLFNFPSRYLSAIGLATVFSLRWSLPPALGCILKQPDSWDARSRRVPRR